MVTKKSKILDLGCGAGVPIAKLLSKDYKVTGLICERSEPLGSIPRP